MSLPAGRLVLGATSIAVGAVLVAGVFGLVDSAAVLSRWWPLAVIAFGFAQMVTEGDLRPGSLLVLAVGLLLLALTSGLVDAPVWPVLGAVALLAGGVALLVPRGRREVVTQAAEVVGVVVLGARRIVSRSSQLATGDVTVVLGSGVVDLTESVPAPGARLAVTVVLGGCEILVPVGWSVRMSGLPLLGGWDDTTNRRAAGAAAPVLEVRVVAVLGAVEVRHPQRWG